MGVLDNPTVREIYETRTVKDAEGRAYPVHSHILPSYTEALYKLLRERQPKSVLEVGMAYGLSSLAIACALEGREARFISIDPFQHTQWSGVGVANVARIGVPHELVQDFSHVALPRLLAEGLRLDFGYIDGNHTFEAVLVDFFYIDKMLEVGGLVAFNDAGWPAIHKVIKWLETNRKYREVDVGLGRTYGKSLRNHIKNRLAGRSAEDRYFEKVEHFDPPYNFYGPF